MQRPAKPDSVNLYEVLGIERTATQDEIRQAYKQLAIKYHPDKNPAGAERFKEIARAYKILSDREQRLEYDSNKKRVSLSDLHKELSQQELREFVDDLMRSERDEEQKRREFERKREEEMRRRAEFDAAHPNFKMSSYGLADIGKGRSGGYSPTERLGSSTPGLSSAYEALQKQREAGLGRDAFFGKRESTPPTSNPSPPPEASAHDLERKYGVTGIGTEYKRKQLESYRSSRFAAPSPRTHLTREGLATTHFPLGPDGVPLADTQVLKSTYERFDYEDYVATVASRGVTRPDKEKLADAILSDALKDYSYSKVVSDVVA
eukprot:TRINITY_DN733_c0_g1_i1.p1 TRINITY_DN733_c0_g1~~TRINITY_DN733_c0_g1_i1.p1  ORF type:complete len:320 (-),score=53.01 TRINITY_DN733_c0_g1_i1:22-981(-)